jgi:predicted nucleotide-binding protein (sugar kinase/HSP70/actin superfamily)
MKITFPHLGNTYIVAKALLDELGIDYVIPPFNNRAALELGSRISPEMACLPLKITVGNLIQAYRQGADTILMAGGCGPCRFGYYCEMQREILKDNGFDMDMITLELPNGDIKEFIRRVGKLAGGFKPYKLYKAIRNATRVSVLVDELERLCFRIRPREIRNGSVDNIYKRFRNDVLEAKGINGIRKLVEEARGKLLAIETDRTVSPLKVGIVGEIYTTIDSHTSFEIQSKLGEMGVEVHREVTVSQWIIEHILKNALHLPRDIEYARLAKPYIGAMIGGHAQETIGNTIMYAKKGFEGVIQIYPLTCMPEIVAESILPVVERDFDIPVLTLIIDEMTGEAGYMTRIEAFIDLLARRRERRITGGERILSWD